MALRGRLPVPAPIVLAVIVAFLSMGYVGLLKKRPTPPDHLREENPHEYGFPSWFGGVSSSSPYFQSIEKFGEDVLDILFFIDLPVDSPSLPSALYLLETLEERSDTEIRSIARFSPSWHDERSTARNLQSVGCRDILWRVGEGEGDIGDACPFSIVINDYASHALLPPKISKWANITLLPEPQHMLAQDATYEALSEEMGPQWDMGLLAHVLPFADPAKFFPNRFVSSYRRVVYFPHPMTPENEWPKMPSDRSYTLYKQRAPPELPNRVRAPDGDPLRPESRIQNFWSGYDKRIGDAMSKGGVCIFDGWQKGILDARMAQAMLAGCLVATVPPDVEYGVLKDLIIPLTPTDEIIPVQQIEDFMTNITDDDLVRRIVKAFIYARQMFPGPTRAQAVIDMIQRFKEGARGYLFPNSFRWTCDSNGEKPAWCD